MKDKKSKEFYLELYKESEFKVPMEVRKRFVRDFLLPFPVVQDYYFYYFMYLYNDLFDTNKKFELLYNDYCKCDKNWDTYLKEYHNMKDNALECVLNDTTYQHFNKNVDMSCFKPLCELKSTKAGNVYNRNFVDQKFISVDMVQSNFNALKSLGVSACKDTETFKDFMTQFGNLESLLEAKNLRQQVLGKLNNKRLYHVEKYMVSCFLYTLLQYNCVTQEDVAVVNKDEVVFYYNDDLKNKLTTYMRLTLKKGVLTLVSDKSEMLATTTLLGDLNFHFDFDIKFKTEVFELSYLEDSKGFLRKFEDGFDFKGVSTINYAKAYKNQLGLEIMNEDNLFVHEGKLACFLE